MKHPPDPTEDTRLTAHVLGEMDDAEAAAFARDAANDPTLLAEEREIAAIARDLTARLGLPNVKLHPDQREALLTQARAIDRRWNLLPLSSPGEGIQNWLIPAASAAVLLVATTIFIRMSARESDRPAAKPAVAAPSRPDPTRRATAENAPAPAVRPMIARTSGTAADFPVLDLPVHPGTPGLDGISKFILSGKRPPRDAIRTEDILNSFTYRLNGVTAIARGAATWHPDNRPDTASRPLATLSSEAISCPWKPSAILLFVSVRTGPQAASRIALSFHADPAAVVRYRLLGHLATGGGVSAKPSSTLPANTTTTLAIEIDPAKSEGALGSLEWSADGAKAPTATLVHRRATEPSDDARFAALVCTYSQWLTGEHAGLIDSEIVGALTREVSSATLPPDRAGFLELIGKSLHLKP